MGQGHGPAAAQPNTSDLWQVAHRGGGVMENRGILNQCNSIADATGWRSSALVGRHWRNSMIFSSGKGVASSRRRIRGLSRRGIGHMTSYNCLPSASQLVRRNVRGRHDRPRREGLTRENACRRNIARKSILCSNNLVKHSTGNREFRVRIPA